MVKQPNTFVTYLSLSSVIPKSWEQVLHDLADLLGHFVRDKVHCLQHCVWEESVLSKQGLNSWLKSGALHADLLMNECSFLV